jgi:hypothetical protein
VSRAVGAATAQVADGWSIDDMVGSFHSKFEAIHQLALVTMEANGSIVDSALPMKVETAEAVADLYGEFCALRAAFNVGENERYAREKRGGAS